MAWTHEQKLAWQKEHRRKNGNIETRRYEKTISGFLMRTYRNMLSRVTGVQWRKAHLYKGFPILSRKEFYVISKSDPDFLRLYIQWKDHRYDQKFTPSINRIDSSIGYENFNLEWITHSENSRLGSLSKRFS